MLLEIDISPGLELRDWRKQDRDEPCRPPLRLMSTRGAQKDCSLCRERWREP